VAALLAALLPRLVALTLIWLLATSTITFAAAGQEIRTEPPAALAAPKAPELVVVPDVRQQAYVFAKGILEDAGFAWRVSGPVEGYAANTVAVQVPAPGIQVVDTGAPTIVLRLARNAEYAERGLPENASPQAGTKLVLASEAGKADAAEPAGDKNSNSPGEPAAPAGEPATAPRKPDFKVPGAPPEPLDEMPLTDRARLVEKRLADRPKPTKALVEYWLYQHAWIVTGAKFGWSGGDEALRNLVDLDRELEARWGIGSRSAAIASAALAEVEAKAGR
jgi:hypothetical protein